MLYCAVGFTLLFSSIWMNFSYNDKIFLEFNSLLNSNQKQIYKEIVLERIKIYFSGMMLGLLLGFLFLVKYPNDKYRLCKFLTIIYVTKLGFYKIHPKKPLMLYSLTTKQQVDAWADIYQEMKHRWISSIIIGFIGYLFIYRII